MEKWISVQQSDFSVEEEYNRLCEANSKDGAVVFFVGRVRDLNDDNAVYEMTLEHYPGMTESVLNEIAEQAASRWSLSRVRIIHRYGVLKPSDQIVLVATSSPHREDAFLSAQFIMDLLKTQAPFWKKEQTNTGERWVDAKDDDKTKEAAWRSF